jgi:hypothetical protein
LGILRGLLGFGSSRQTKQSGTAGSRSRRCALEFSPLEDRTLLSFMATSIQASQTILPPNNKFVPVTITGTFQEYHVVVTGTGAQAKATVIDAVQPGPKRSSFQVVDQYRKVQPQGKISLVLTDPVKGKYSYSFTVNLQATRRNADIFGRHYNIIVGAGDSDGWNGEVVTILVPHSI